MPNADPSRPSILLIAGDVSGDVHIAGLARTLIAHDPNRTLHALGGRRVREIISRSPGGLFLGDTTNCSAIGISSAIKIYFRCRKLGDQLREFVHTHQIDLAVLCDWGGFNGRALPILHSLGIPTLYYFPPRSWQRTGSPGLGIVPYVTRVATPFKWSADRLRSAGAKAEWVGHPSLDNIPSREKRPALRKKFGVAPNKTLVALLPGSRPSEIRVIAPRLAKVISIVKESADVEFIAVVPKELAEQVRSYLPSSIRTLSDCAGELLLASDAAIVKTGTATLEAALAGTPQVTVYDASVAGRIEWCLLWAWRKIPFIAMPNIILQREAVPELIGLNCQPEKIAQALLHILENKQARDEMVKDYGLVRKALGSDLRMSPTARTAAIVDEILTEVMETAEPERVAV
ncbi:MAG TPA: hypothetical protein VGM62_09385 [Chthoniobacterales bacterium]